MKPLLFLLSALLLCGCSHPSAYDENPNDFLTRDQCFNNCMEARGNPGADFIHKKDCICYFICEQNRIDAPPWCWDSTFPPQPNGH